MCVWKDGKSISSRFQFSPTVDAISVSSGARSDQKTYITFLDRTKFLHKTSSKSAGTETAMLFCTYIGTLLPKCLMNELIAPALHPSSSFSISSSNSSQFTCLEVTKTQLVSVTSGPLPRCEPRTVSKSVLNISTI